ncbi:hypothetical protein Strvi_4331 [Streptomyces violaceusniger Tu 4113]|uniref:Uncharacterized protein n=1 Tax=Streptomyces violaceusniger (strain Tu 4113) TaxID=653045 RepID=G2P4U1_STRV4|nr:hypothetical protein Strvi_4331 [Streptomyces violaceusniger Tu 4113]
MSPDLGSKASHTRGVDMRSKVSLAYGAILIALTERFASAGGTRRSPVVSRT